jgi:multidrug efflux pump
MNRTETPNQTSLSQFFISRPIFAAVLSIVIVIVGAIAYATLPVAQFPEVVPPTVVVTASYPGASPEVIADTVATPIEQEVNGVEEMLYMSSQATNDGRLTLTVTFKLGTDLDKAQVLVQNRVAIAEPRLPEEVRRIGITTEKSSPDLLLVVHLLSPDNTYDQLYISNYAYLQIRDILRRIDGVGAVNVFGAREFSMRVWLDPEKLAALNLTAGEVVQALREQNVQVAAGVIAQQPTAGPTAFQLSVNTLGRLTEEDQFRDIVVKTGESGRIARLRDVADVRLGALDYSVNSYVQFPKEPRKPAVAMVIQQRPGSNALATASAIKETMAHLSKDFPTGLEHRVIYDPTVFVEESINSVLKTVLEAVALVVIVVMLFLQSWRASLIPLLAIPVSLVGTFAVMAGLGFSLNNLSLFGLVLAIGIVVDDAIVVVENIERHIHEGLSPLAAARRAMSEVSGAVIAVGLVLAAVFVPTAFLGGISGQFYRQFALTIAVSTLISVFVSLTLSPALGALLIQHKHAPRDWFARIWDRLLGRLFRGFNAAFDRAAPAYGQAVARLVRRSWLALVLYAGLIALTVFLFQVTPGGFIPQLDQGYAIIAAQLPDSASLTRTDEVLRRTSDIALSVPGITAAVSFAGFSGATRANATNAGALFAVFAPFDERIKTGRPGAAIIEELRTRLSAVQEGFLVVIPPPPVQGLGTGGGFNLQVQDRYNLGSVALQDATDRLVSAARAEPGLVQVFSTFRASTPQLYAEVDRAKAKMLDVPLSNVFDSLQVNLGSVFVNELNLFGRTFRVTAQAAPEFRDDPSDIARLKTRNRRGGAVPLGSVVDVRETTGPDRVIRYNLFPSADVNGDTARGFSSGQSLATLERLAREHLPQGFTFEWTDLAYQQKLAGNTALFIFPLCVLFVYLTLAAQYESWSLPMTIILIVPMCLMCGIGGVLLRGLDNNILTQIGFIVLVGLACKNAILIVEFAKQLQDQGRNRFDAAVEACRLRLRPILMTSFAFILGVLPLVRAEGASAEMRQSLGTVVFFGMLGVTFFGLFLTPVFYVVIQGFSEGKERA